MIESIFGKNGSERRRRWMIYPIYAGVLYVCRSVTVVLTTLNETRKFIGGGAEFCWMYGSFERYLIVSFIVICVDTAMLLGLYWLSRRNYLMAYLTALSAWLFLEPVLSFFDMGYC
jgi:hypothetical protein